MIPERWKYAHEFKTREDAEEFKHTHDKDDHYKVVDTLDRWR